MIKEVDVAKPIELYLENLGFRVRSEVKGCDITAIKDNDLLVVECKKNFSIKLIYQCLYLNKAFGLYHFCEKLLPDIFFPIL